VRLQRSPVVYEFTRVICPPGGVIMFSTLEMRSSVTKTSGFMRVGTDFRTVQVDQAIATHGTPNVDSACTGN
jgi:hypothetical protein